MSLNSQEQPWSDSPGAPKIPYYLYLSEKATFAGFLIGAILYGAHEEPPLRCPSDRALFVCSVNLGVLIILFFQCMTALFSLASRREEGIRWGLVSYTAIMFSFATVYTAMNLNFQSVSFVDNRDFLGLGGPSLGPLGYQALARSELSNLIPNLMFLLNCWLADGLFVGYLFDPALACPGVLRLLMLQLYRCYVIYAMKSWAVIVLPCFLYLSCVGAYF